MRHWIIPSSKIVYNSDNCNGGSRGSDDGLGSSNKILTTIPLTGALGKTIGC